MIARAHKFYETWDLDRRRWKDDIKMDLQEVEKGLWELDGVGSG
jgi:hypothetical protein